MAKTIENRIAKLEAQNGIGGDLYVIRLDGGYIMPDGKLITPERWAEIERTYKGKITVRNVGVSYDAI